MKHGRNILLFLKFAFTYLRNKALAAWMLHPIVLWFAWMPWGCCMYSSCILRRSICWTHIAFFITFRCYCFGCHLVQFKCWHRSTYKVHAAQILHTWSVEGAQHLPYNWTHLPFLLIVKLLRLLFLCSLDHSLFLRNFFVLKVVTIFNVSYFIFKYFLGCFRGLFLLVLSQGRHNRVSIFLL